MAQNKPKHLTIQKDVKDYLLRLKKEIKGLTDKDDQRDEWG